MLGYFWLLYRDPQDMFLLFSETNIARHSIFQRKYNLKYDSDFDRNALITQDVTDYADTYPRENMSRSIIIQDE